MQISTIDERVLIFSPHPDDDILACGGLIQQLIRKKIPVRIVFITDGDNNPWPQRIIERRWRINKVDRQRWGQKRRREAIAGLNALAFDIRQAIFLGLPDQGITDLLLQKDQQVIQRVWKEILDWKPTTIISPAAFDLHPDHSASAVLIRQAIEGIAFDKIGFSKPELLYFVVHPNRLYAENSACIPLTKNEVVLKKIALSSHETQLLLSKKRFMSYVLDQEYFYKSVDATLNKNPLKSTFIFGEMLNIVLQKPQISTWLLRPQLRIVSGAESSVSLRLRMSLFDQNNVNIYDSENQIISSKGRISLHGKLALVSFPLTLLKQSLQIWTKLDSPRWLSDCSGWKNMSLVKAELDAITARLRKNTVVLIPCYNLVNLCGPVISNAARYADQVIVVDDGSSDGTRQVIEKIVSQGNGNIHLIKKDINEGKGFALIDAMQYALQHYVFDTLITMDGDGQHRPDDIPKAVKALSSNNSFVIGERDFSKMPLRSRFGNTVTSWMFRLLYGHSPNDTQSGFRAFTPEFVSQIVCMVEKGRYETELYILLLALDSSIKMGKFAIDTVYLDKNRSSHFRPVADSVKIILSLLQWQIGSLF